jgi:Na+:H+ antiporter, NhaC family
MKTNKNREPSLLISLIPLLFLVIALSVFVIKYGLKPHMPLIFTGALTALLARFNGVKWETSLAGMVNGIKTTLPAVLLLMIVGLLIASWLQSGIVPSLIYYGFYIVSPRFFLFTAAVLSALVSLATGSSWSTAATIGVALMGLGKGLDIPPAMTAGAIISGAYFGDKMSPLSDTTNLAPAVAGAKLFTHIRHMLWTTGPGFTIALIGYLILGFIVGGKSSESNFQLFTQTISSNFNITPFLLIPPVVVIFLVAKKKPALPSLLLGVIMGMICSMIFQDGSINSILKNLQGGFKSTTGLKSMDKLLSGGGLDNMMSTVSLIISAVSFGGLMEVSGFLKTITQNILKLVRGVGSLVLVTIGTAIGLNIVAGDQFIAIILPGKMYKETYDKFNLAPQNLSRALEDSATLTSPLIPWNTCGAYMWVTLGVFPLYYLPFAFLNLLNPVISIIYGFTGFTMTKKTVEANTK